MAGDWIPMRVDLSDDPAVIAIAVATGLDEYAVVGRLHRLWVWANRHLSSGHAVGVTDQWIDRFLTTPGFAAAMLNAGWLRLRAGSVEFPNFERWNSQGAKRRLLAAQRKRAERSQKCHAPGVTKTRPEKRRVKTKDPPNPPSGGGEEKTSEGNAPPGRPRNHLFDAIAEVTGSDPSIRSQASLLGAKAAELAAADPPYTPDEVREFGQRFHELCSWAAKDNRTRPTPGEVVNHIGQLRAKPVTPAAAAPPRKPVLDFGTAAPHPSVGGPNGRP